MNIEIVRSRTDALLNDALGTPTYELQSRIHQGTLGLLHAVYGRDSSRERDLCAGLDRLAGLYYPSAAVTVESSVVLIRGALQSIKSDIDAGFLGSLRAAIAGDVLSDLIRFARTVSVEAGEGAKSVSAVLAAAAFEDCLRRLAESAGCGSIEKLADVVTALKEHGILKDAQVGIAQSYLGFRNRALHAKWAEIDKPEIASVLGFTEELIIKFFA